MVWTASLMLIASPLVEESWKQRTNPVECRQGDDNGDDRTVDDVVPKLVGAVAHCGFVIQKQDQEYQRGWQKRHGHGLHEQCDITQFDAELGIQFGNQSPFPLRSRTDRLYPRILVVGHDLTSWVQ